MADCLSGDQRQERFDLMSYAVDKLTANPATAVYVDAGHSRWVAADEMANRLNQVGVAKARGFSLNTANFFTTEESMGYGDAISGMTGGKPYVIDTSRNGAGPADGDMYWCNPSGRALGAAPTTDTGNGNVDAFLWVKRPGESDGSCNGGPGQARSSASTPSTWPRTPVSRSGQSGRSAGARLSRRVGDARAGHQSVCGPRHMADDRLGGLAAITRFDGVHDVVMTFGIHVLHRPIDSGEHDRHADASFERGPLVKQRLVATQLAHGAMKTEVCFDTVLEAGRCRAVHVVDGTVATS